MNRREFIYETAGCFQALSLHLATRRQTRYAHGSWLKLSPPKTACNLLLQMRHS